jgi:hypothetical protein
MRTKPALALLSIAAVALGACTSGATPSAPAGSAAASQIAVATLTASAVQVDSASPAASSASQPPASSGGGGSQATPGSIDPCSLLTADEASTAAGKKLGAGVSTQLEAGRACTFKSGSTEVRVLLAPPAPDAKTALAYWDQARSEIAADIPIKDLTYFDRSAYGAGSVGGDSLSALFVIHGTYFFDLYCGFPACSETASVTAAQLIVGRLP